MSNDEMLARALDIATRALELSVKNRSDVAATMARIERHEVRCDSRYEWIAESNVRLETKVDALNNRWLTVGAAIISVLLSILGVLIADKFF